MNAKRRLFARLSLLLLLVMLTVQPVFANSAPPSPWYTIELTNLPEGTVYVDMLIPLEENDEMYVPLEKSNLPDGFTAQSQIVTFFENGYRSYTFHYRDASSNITPRTASYINNPYITFFADAIVSEESIRYEHKEDISDRKTIRLAMLDENGNILKVSRILRLDPNRLFVYTPHTYVYNALADTLEAETATSWIAVVLYVCLCIIGLFLTVFLERLTAFFFRLGKENSGLISRTNVLSQICMHAAFLLLYSRVFYRYSYAVIALEIAVYLGEFLVYRKFMRNVSPIKCLLYTLTANTVSLGCGLLLMLLN